MEEAIPKEWLAAVVAILRRGRFDREIAFPITSRNRWDADSFGQPMYELRDALIAVLKPGVIGKFVPDQHEIGQTYAFRLPVGRQIFYGKICLHAGHKTIKLLSAHRPLKGERL